MISYFLMASLGLCYILKYGTILNSFRNFLSNKCRILNDLFKCSLCLGFWCGIVLIPILIECGNSLSISLIYPFASASFCWTMDMFMDFLIAVVKDSKNNLD